MIRTVPLLLFLLLVSTAGALAQRNAALRFNSPTAKVTVRNSADLNFAGDFTIEMWIWITSNTAPFSNIIEKQDNEYSLYVTNAGKINGSISTATQFVEVTTNDALPTGMWHHLAMVYDQKRGLLKLFLNGKPNGTSTVSPTEPVLPTTKDLIIGGSTASAAVFKGYIDELRLSNSVRFTTDFDPKATSIADTNAVALFHFDEATGNTTADGSRKGHQGYLTDVAWVSIPLGLAPLSAPARATLEANYPNPFSSSTEIGLFLPAPESAGATLRVYNALGQLVADYSSALHPGENRIRVAEGIFRCAGTYLSVLRTPSGTITQKMIRVGAR